MMGVLVHLALEMQTPAQGGLHHDARDHAHDDARRGMALDELAHEPALFDDPNSLPQACVDVHRDVCGHLGGVENHVKREQIS